MYNGYIRKKLIYINKIERIKELTKQLNIYRNEYYNLNKSSVSDSIYDSLFDELKALEEETDMVMATSPTITVGYPVVSKLQKRVHPTALKSLSKTKSIDELNKWRNGKDIILMLKADGLTVELDYEDGLLVGGFTRGNGEIGEDISFNCKTFMNIPIYIPFEGKLRISGEAIIHWNDFNEINSKLSDDEKYATPRNLVAGSVRQLDSKICLERNVYFYAFNILEAIDTETNVDVLDDSKYENFKWLGSLGFSTIINTKCEGDITIEQINASKNIAETLNIPIDGLVTSFDSIKYSQSLGEVAHHPLFSLAFKFKDESETTILKEIEWSVGRTGVITPVAIFDKVLLDNTEVTRASLHNLSIMEDLEIGIGDSISIIKCNMIIPQIEENFTRSNNCIIPEECPVCSGITMIDQDNESKFLYCTNEDCSAKLIKKFSHFVSRDAMNIEGLSEATIEKFLDEGFITKFPDIYKIEQYKSKIVKMEGFGLKSYTNMINAIEKSKNVTMANFLYSLGIEQIGTGGAKRLAKHFNNNITKFFDALEDHYDFSKIEDFGQVTADAVTEYFTNGNNANMVSELLDYVNIKSGEDKKVNIEFKDLSDLTFVITGSVNTFKNREDFKELVESLNGKVAGSVSNKTNYLVNNDTTSTSGKNQKAKELGVKIISENDFNSMIGRLF